MDLSRLQGQSFINGKWSQSKNKKIPVINKYSQELLKEVSVCSSAEIEEALDSSHSSFIEMKSFSSEKRSGILKDLHDKLQERREEFAQLITLEAGKPKSYSRAEISRCLTTLKLASEEALRFDGEKVPVDFGAGKGKQGITKNIPLGPILAISPFNFPLNLALHKIAPALAVGCSIILKPSPITPLTALAFASLVADCQLPKGLINVVICENDLTGKMIEDDRVKILSFTGGPRVGRELNERAKKKKVILELGGNAAVYVDESCNVENVASQLVLGAFLYSGQICISTQRIYAHHNIFEKLKSCLIQEIEKVKVGDPNSEEVIVGPLINQESFDRISEWVSKAIKGGAHCLAGGKSLDPKRFVYAPTLLTDTHPEMEVVKEEAFGPLAIIESVDHFEDGLLAINNSKFGLQAGVFTQRIDQMKMAFQNLEVGGVIMNGVPGLRLDNMPYGGLKESGFGREGVRYSMEEYTTSKILIF